MHIYQPYKKNRGAFASDRQKNKQPAIYCFSTAQQQKEEENDADRNTKARRKRKEDQSQQAVIKQQLLTSKSLAALSTLEQKRIRR